MAYYDALRAKWATAPAGTTQSKMDWINAQTVAGPPVPMLVAGYALYNKINRAEYVALTAANSASVHDICALPMMDFSPNLEMRNHLLALFTQAKSPITYGNLMAWCALFDTPQVPWWGQPVANGGGGLSSPVNQADLTAAGLS